MAVSDASSARLVEAVGRRTFLKVLGSAGSAIGLTACAVPPERIIPYVIPPENEVPGVATRYATVCRECPSGCGMVVRTREGRAVKVEGNPEHPVNRGSLCIRGQASLQGLYNPDRIQEPQERRVTNAASDQSVLAPITWNNAQETLLNKILSLKQQGRSDRIALVTPSITGSLDRLFDSWAKTIGIHHHLRYEPFAYEAIRTANHLNFGQSVLPHYDFSKPRLLISFGADFLETWISNVGYARDFAQMKNARSNHQAKFVHIEPRLSMTAANADEWLSVEPESEILVALAMTHTILRKRIFQDITSVTADAIFEIVREYSPETVTNRTSIPARKIEELATLFSDPSMGPGTSLAIGGGTATSGNNATATQIALNLLNYVSGNIGRTVTFDHKSNETHANTYKDTLNLVEAMQARLIDLLILHDVNPLFTLPEATGFSAGLSKIPFVVSLSSFPDETTARSDLILPVHTPLESWGDHESRGAIRGLMQPVMQSIFNTKHVGDILLEVIRELGEEEAAAFPSRTFDAYLKNEWRNLHEQLTPESDFQTFWADALRRGGFWQKTQSQVVDLNLDSLPTSLALVNEEEDTDNRPFVLMPYPSLHHYDGRGANKPWLQEIADPMMKVAWDSWAELHPDTCKRLNVEEGQLLTIESPHGRLDASILENKHLRPGVIAIPIGQGHTRYGRYAEGRGANPISLLNPIPEVQSGGLRWLSTKVSATPRPLWRKLSKTQENNQQLGRNVAQAISTTDLIGAVPEAHQEHLSMYANHEHPVHRWGMTIDLNACNGCNACIAACNAENNVPVVGPNQVALGRSMSWLRIERYFDQSDSVTDTRFVPMLCQHCDHAPCESVCPVYATYHTPEGLNAQIYNRCVGTRYCSNNCPYKVRQFNWHEAEFPEPLNLQLNPDVTVRSKGVMEKCSFCVQRIQEGKGRAKDEGRQVRDEDVVPACAQTCPAQAIVFGDLNDPHSQASRLSKDPRGYRVFDELNTRPAITYLKKVTQKRT